MPFPAGKCPGHALHTARHHDLTAFGLDLVKGKHHRLHTGSTNLVDSGTGCGFADSRAERGLPRGCLPDASAQHITHKHFIHLGGVQTGPLQYRAYGDRAEFRCRQ